MAAILTISNTNKQSTYIKANIYELNNNLLQLHESKQKELISDQYRLMQKCSVSLIGAESLIVEPITNCRLDCRVRFQSNVLGERHAFISFPANYELI